MAIIGKWTRAGFATLLIATAFQASTSANNWQCAAGDSACLIAAMKEAQSGTKHHVVRLESGIYALTEPYAGVGPNSVGLPPVSARLTIVGAGQDSTIIERAEGVPTFRLLNIEASGHLHLRQLTLRRGQSSMSGGGILNDGRLSMHHVTLRDGSASQAGGIHNRGSADIVSSRLLANGVSFGGGAVLNTGTMTIVETDLGGNSADNGSAFGNTGTLRIERSRIFDNFGNGSTLWNIVSGRVEIRSSTLARNRTGSVSGDLVSNFSTMTIVNSTIAGNLSRGAPGRTIVNGGSLVLLSTTVADNRQQADVGRGAVVNLEGGELAMGNTIIDRNDDALGPDCAGDITSLGGNVIGSVAGCSIQLQPTDRTGEASLGAYSDGAIPLLATSQAIDAGEPSQCTPLDQRGAPRVDGNADGTVVCDSGAVEFIHQPVRLTLGRWPLRQLVRGNAVIHVLGSPNFDVASVDEGSIRAGATGQEAVPTQSRRVDVNDDGHSDLRLVFLIESLGIGNPPTFSLTAKTLSGQTVAGTLSLP